MIEQLVFYSAMELVPSCRRQNASGTKEDRGILSVDLNSDGNFRDILYVDGGVSQKTTGYLRMEGKEVFKHAVDKLAKTSEKAMMKAGIETAEIDWVVPHQANVRIIQGTARKMGIPTKKLLKPFKIMNTSAASIPLALSVHEIGQIEKNDLIVTEAIGGGLAENNSAKMVKYVLYFEFKKTQYC